MKDNRVMTIIYTLFLGILLAVFVGVGINTFYAPPAAPKFPIESNTYGKEPTPVQVAAQQAFDRENEKYRNALKPYNRNVSIVALVAAVVLLVAGLLSQKRIRSIADGIMLGGLFTLLDSIGRGFASEDSKYVFIIVAIGLVLVLYLGYSRFVSKHGDHPPQKQV